MNDGNDEKQIAIRTCHSSSGRHLLHANHHHRHDDSRRHRHCRELKRGGGRRWRIRHMNSSLCTSYAHF